MSVVRVVPQEDYNVMMKYLAGQASGVVVIIPEDVAKRNQLTHLDERYIDYDCGGDPDLYVEVVSHDGHYFINQLRENEEDNFKTVEADDVENKY
jgi:hypothetical protein